VKAALLKVSTWQFSAGRVLGFLRTERGREYVSGGSPQKLTLSASHSVSRGPQLLLLNTIQLHMQTNKNPIAMTAKQSEM
jgi:hypothetical protein